jgi:adenylate kinase
VGESAKRIVFLGPPNSGKGTQAVRLASRLGVPAISTGEMLRAAVAAGTDLGRRVKAVMEGGQLVSDELMADLITERLAQNDARPGFLLDGYPRTAPQCRLLDKIVDEGGETLDLVLFLDAPDDVLIDRALGRGRPDDEEKIVRRRLEVYRSDTAPLVDEYRRRGLLHEIDGNLPIEEVEARISTAVGL